MTTLETIGQLLLIRGIMLGYDPDADHILRMTDRLVYGDQAVKSKL